VVPRGKNKWLIPRVKIIAVEKVCGIVENRILASQGAFGTLAVIGESNQRSHYTPGNELLLSLVLTLFFYPETVARSGKLRIVISPAPVLR
jgi:hypothetical protein